MVQLCDEITYASDGDIVYTDSIYSGNNFDNLTCSEIIYKDLTFDLTTAFNSSQREIKNGLIIYFPSDVEGFLTEDISKQGLLEETFAESQTPLGAVSSNELTVTLYNEDNNFSPNNSLSPYYGKLLPNIYIDAFVGIKLSDGTIEYVYLGNFSTTDWNAPTGGLEVGILCNDKLRTLGNKIVPQIPIQNSSSISQLFRCIFNSLGLTEDEYSIDDISHSVNITSFSESKVMDILQDLAERGLAYVFCDRNGKIRVIRSNNVENPSSFTWQDTDMLINADIPVQYQDIYSQIEITYAITYADVPTTVLSSIELEIPSGGLTLSNFAFGSVVGSIDNIILKNNINSYITSMTIGAESISLTFANTGASETITLEILGRAIVSKQAVYLVSDSDTQALIGNIKLAINNNRIQTKDDAILYASKLLTLIINPAAYVTASSRGNPVISLVNSIRINDTIDNIINLDVVPIRMDYTFTDGISCNMVSIKRSLRETM